jgi:hypothetical protein
MNTIMKVNGRFVDLTLTGTAAEVSSTVTDNELAGRLVFVTPAQPVPGTDLIQAVIRLRPDTSTVPTTARVSTPDHARPALTAAPHGRPVGRPRRRVLLYIGTPAGILAATAVGGYTAGYHGVGVTVLRTVLGIVALVLIAAAVYEIGTKGVGHHCPGCPDQ